MDLLETLDLLEILAWLKVLTVGALTVNAPAAGVWGTVMPLVMTAIDARDVIGGFSSSMNVGMQKNAMALKERKSNEEPSAGVSAI